MILAKWCITITICLNSFLQIVNMQHVAVACVKWLYHIFHLFKEASSAGNMLLVERISYHIAEPDLLLHINTYHVFQSMASLISKWTKAVNWPRHQSLISSFTLDTPTFQVPLWVNARLNFENEAHWSVLQVTLLALQRSASTDHWIWCSSLAKGLIRWWFYKGETCDPLTVIVFTHIGSQDGC